MLKNCRTDKVILVHGIASKKFWMRFLAARISKRGYDTESWGYNSFVGSLERHAKRLSNRLATLDLENDFERIHIVAHSMGSIIVRLALSYYTPRNLGRIVLLAPPNQGSLIATIAGPVFKLICPALGQLANTRQSFVRQMTANRDLSIGIIAAKFDVLVGTKSTHLEFVRDHICITATHNTLLFQPNVGILVDRFLQTERFSD